MITRPSIERQLENISDRLAQDVAPLVTDADAALTLQLAILVLRDLTARLRDEEGWLREEIAAIEARIAGLAAAPDAPPALGVALDRFRAARADTALTDRYDLAGNLLSEALDIAFDAGDDGLLAPLEDLLCQRAEHEGALLGTGFDWNRG
ncbi:MAG: hypothetical protein ACYDHH_33715 [Solirubrobacteraceae bacterium]